MVRSEIESNFPIVGLLGNASTFLSTSGSLSDGDAIVHPFGGIVGGATGLVSNMVFGGPNLGHTTAWAPFDLFRAATFGPRGFAA